MATSKEAHSMKNGNTLSLGQQANFIAAVTKALPRDINPDVARRWEQNGEALTKVLREALYPPSVPLSAPTLITLPAASAPQRLADRKDVRLFGRAPELFGPVKKRSEVPECTLEWWKLEDRLDDFEFISELSGEDVAVSDSIEETDDTIGRLIDAQPGGISGDLLTDGRADIFFVRDPQNPPRVLFVSVRWDGDGREWYVISGPADACRWFRGYRVFREATAA